jgi:hypothetical protein
MDMLVIVIGYNYIVGSLRSAERVRADLSGPRHGRD